MCWLKCHRLVAEMPRSWLQCHTDGCHATRLCLICLFYSRGLRTSCSLQLKAQVSMNCDDKCRNCVCELVWTLMNFQNKNMKTVEQQNTNNTERCKPNITNPASNTDLIMFEKCFISSWRLFHTVFTYQVLFKVFYFAMYGSTWPLCMVLYNRYYRTPQVHNKFRNVQKSSESAKTQPKTMITHHEHVIFEKGPSPPFSWTNPHQTNKMVFVLQKTTVLTQFAFVSACQHHIVINNNKHEHYKFMRKCMQRSSPPTNSVKQTIHLIFSAQYMPRISVAFAFAPVRAKVIAPSSWYKNLERWWKPLWLWHHATVLPAGLLHNQSNPSKFALEREVEGAAWWKPLLLPSQSRSAAHSSPSPWHGTPSLSMSKRNEARLAQSSTAWPAWRGHPWVLVTGLICAMRRYACQHTRT